jgi:hypothetical protein
LTSRTLSSACIGSLGISCRNRWTSRKPKGASGRPAAQAEGRQRTRTWSKALGTRGDGTSAVQAGDSRRRGWQATRNVERATAAVTRCGCGRGESFEGRPRLREGRGRNRAPARAGESGAPHRLRGTALRRCDPRRSVGTAGWLRPALVVDASRTVFGPARRASASSNLATGG